MVTLVFKFSTHPQYRGQAELHKKQPAANTNMHTSYTYEKPPSDVFQNATITRHTALSTRCPTVQQASVHWYMVDKTFGHAHENTEVYGMIVDMNYT